MTSGLTWDMWEPQGNGSREEDTVMVNGPMNQRALMAHGIPGSRAIIARFLSKVR